MTHSYQERAIKRGIESITPILDILGEGPDALGNVCGSYATFCIADRPIEPNDVDIFARSFDNAERIAKDLRARGAKLTRRGNWIYQFHKSLIGLPIQVIIPPSEWKDYPSDILNSFDLDISRAAIMTRDCALAHWNAGGMHAKILRISNISRCWDRVQKYIARGVYFSDVEFMKLAYARVNESAVAGVELALEEEWMGDESDPWDNFED